MSLKPALIDEIRDARRALRAEGKRDTQDAVIDKLGHGSKTTMVDYWPFTTPETATMDTAVAEQARNHTGGSMPLAQETGAQVTAPAPVDTMPQREAALDTAPRPALLEARARYHAARERVRSIDSVATPLKQQIEALQMRQAALTAEHATVTNLERYRAVKAELLDIEDQLVILERQYAPHGMQAEASRKEASTLRVACEHVRQRALTALDAARVQHFAVVHQQFGAQPRELDRRVAALAELVGEDDVAQYVTSMTWPNEIPGHVPPWDSPFWVDAS